MSRRRRRGTAAGASPAVLASRWTPEQAAEFAARRDFRLAQLLAKDRRALAAARQLGLCAARSTRQQTTSKQTASTVVDAPSRRVAQTQTVRNPDDVTANSRQRRSRTRMQAFLKRKEQAAAPPPETRDGDAMACEGGVPPSSDAQTQTAADVPPPTESRIATLEEELARWRATCNELWKDAANWKNQCELLLRQQQQQQQQQRQDIQPPPPQQQQLHALRGSGSGGTAVGYGAPPQPARF